MKSFAHVYLATLLLLPSFVSAAPSDSADVPPNSLPATSAAEAPAREPAAAPLPPPVALSTRTACAYNIADWAGRDNITDLGLRSGEAAFVRISGGAARLSIPVGPVGDALLAVEDSGLSVRGHIAISAVALWPQRPFVLNGLAIPTRFAELSWSEAMVGALVVTHPIPADLWVADAPLRARIACADVGLDEEDFDAAKSVPATAGKKPAGMALVPGSEVPISVKPQGPPTARIKVTKATVVDVLATRGKLSRVSFEMDTLIVFGWVPTSALQTPGPMTGYGSGSGWGRPPAPQWEVMDRLLCAYDIPLMAEVNGERATVGEIRKGTAIDIIARTHSEAQVWVRTKSIHVAPDAILLARSADLAACGRLVSPPASPREDRPVRTE